MLQWRGLFPLLASVEELCIECEMWDGAEADLSGRARCFSPDGFHSLFPALTVARLYHLSCLPQPWHANERNAGDVSDLSISAHLLQTQQGREKCSVFVEGELIMASSVSESSHGDIFSC